MLEALKFLLLFAALIKATLSRQWSLGIIAFFLPLSLWLPQTGIPGLNATNLLLMPVLLHAFAAGRAPNLPGRRDPLVIPVVVLTGLVLVSLVRVRFDRYLPVGFLQKGGLYSNVLHFKEMVVSLLLYFCARRLVKDPMILRFAIVGALGGYLIQAISGTSDFLRGVESANRAAGYFGSSGMLGHFLAGYAMLPAAALLQRTRGLFMGAALMVALSFLGILGSLSRGALLAFGAGLTCMAIVKRSLWIVVLAGVVISSPVWLPQSVMDRFQESRSRDRTGLSSVPGFQSAEEFEPAREERMKIWRAGLNMVGDKPLLGVGLGQYAYSLNKYGYETSRKKSAHNVPLALAAECGIPASIAHLAIIIILARFALRVAAAGNRTLYSTFGLGVFGATVAFATSGMVQPMFYSSVFAGSYFILAGATVSLYVGIAADEPLDAEVDNESQSDTSAAMR